MRAGIVLALAAAQAAAAPGTAPEPAAEVERVAYLARIYGQIHQNPSPHSTALSTVKCGHPVRILAREDGRAAAGGEWLPARAGPHRGYVRRDHVSDARPACPQDRYGRFFDGLGLSLTDVYRWGRLQALLLEGASPAPPGAP